MVLERPETSRITQGLCNKRKADLKVQKGSTVSRSTSGSSDIAFLRADYHRLLPIDVPGCRQSCPFLLVWDLESSVGQAGASLWRHLGSVICAGRQC